VNLGTITYLILDNPAKHEQRVLILPENSFAIVSEIFFAPFSSATYISSCSLNFSPRQVKNLVSNQIRQRHLLPTFRIVAEVLRKKVLQIIKGSALFEKLMSDNKSETKKEFDVNNLADSIACTDWYRDPEKPRQTTYLSTHLFNNFLSVLVITVRSRISKDE
jgi:hypothetical protein